MKATKKIVGAACALVSAVALSAGATFAWFSTNGSVDAKGLEVKVSTNNAYLVIADTVAGLKDGKKEISLEKLGKDEDNKAIELLPSAYKKATVTETKDGDGKVTGHTVTTSDTHIEWADSTTDSEKMAITEKTTWYTGKGYDEKDGSLVGTGTALTAGNFDNYVITAKMYLSVSGSASVSKVNMTFTYEFEDENKENDAITLLVLYRKVENKEGATVGAWSHSETTLASDGKFGTNSELNLLDGDEDGLSSTHYIEVCVMVYFDGNSSVVTTDNQANLTGASFDFNFAAPDTVAKENA